MPIAVTMRGMLEPILIKEDFQTAVTDMNIAAASGKEFLLANSVDGGAIAMALHNILSIREVEEDDALIGR